MAINRIDDGAKHGGSPLFEHREPTGGLFRDNFAARKNGFVPPLTHWITKSAHVTCFAQGGDDSIMLDAVMLLLGLAACALVLFAF